MTEATYKVPNLVPPLVVVNSNSEDIPFIDESGSSCSSSLLGDLNFLDTDDTASINHLLDDAASRELSFNGFHDDLTSFYDRVSLDAQIECPSDSPAQLRKARLSLNSRGSQRSSSYSNKSSPQSRRTSRSSIKSSDNLDDDVISGEPPKLPPTLPPCITCGETSSSCSISSSVLSCTTCAADSDLPCHTDSDRCPHMNDKNRNNNESPTVVIKDEEKKEITPINEDDQQSSPDIKREIDLPDGKDLDHTIINGRITPPNTQILPKEVWSPGDDPPVPLITSTPMQQQNDSSLSPGGSLAPHHYISSLRVASMRGAADMGGALVARVATFLRSQYKSLVNNPLILTWCPYYKLVISDMEISLVQVPLNSQMKVPKNLVPIDSIMQPQQVSFNESTVEERPRRVLIEGHPGYAKSNICFKLAYDWAINPTLSYLSNYSLVFVLTLRDFKGGSIFSHMCKEVLPRHILTKEAMNTLWLHIKKIEDKVLFLLDGYDELIEEEAGDLLDLVEGKMFPKSGVIIASRLCSSKMFPSQLHRRFFIAGFSPDQTENFIHRYFDSLNKTNSGQDVLSLIMAQREKYKYLMTCPVMCLALGVLYEDHGGKFPSRITDLYMSFIKHMIRKLLLKKGEPMCYDVLPDKYCRLLQEFGKLALEAIKNNSPYFTSQDLKTKCYNGTEVVDLGILIRMLSMSKLNKKEYLTPTHISMLEFLAAYYLSGLINDYTLLQNEIDSIADKLDVINPNPRQGSGQMVLRYLVGLLGRNAYIVFNIVSQMGVSQRVLFLLLRETGTYQMNVIETCKHVSGREHVVIQTNSPELDDFGRLLFSPDCMLEGVEVILDFDGSCRDQHESFFTSMSFNESVKSVKLTCVVGGDFGEPEVTRLVSYVRAVITKRRLESFEILVTSLEESQAEILSPVVDMICDTLPELAPALNKLVVALELESYQVVKLCEILKETPNVKILHLPHLACGLEGLKAVGNLITSSPLVAINLAGSLSSGTPIDDRTGPPSPTREDPSPLSFWSFTDAQGNKKSVFSSLPRSFYQSIPRRGRMNTMSCEKRNSDTTLLQKTSFPPPTCSPSLHLNGFHEVFSAFRNPECRVCHLNISKCTMGAEDLVCLGETVRFTKCLSSLRMEGFSRMAEIIPVLVALQDNKSLQLLDLTSNHILLGDAAFQVTLSALTKNKSLRFLVLNGWTFQLETEKSLKEFMNFLNSSDLQHLDLSNCRVVLTVQDGPLTKVSCRNLGTELLESVPPLTNNSLAFLKLDNFEITINQKTVLRGPELVFLLKHMRKLVDISLTSNLGAEVIDEALTRQIFAHICASFPCLRKLTLGGWKFSVNNSEKLMRSIGKEMKGCVVREIFLPGVEVRETGGKTECEYTLLQGLTSNLHHLSLLSLYGLRLSSDQTQLLGKAMKEKLCSSSLQIETKGLSYQAVKALRQALTEGGRYELHFLGGPMATYQVKKIDRREKMLGKWACISTLDKMTGLD